MRIIEINQNKQGGVFQQVIVGGFDLTQFVLGGTVRRSIGNPAGEFELKLRPLKDKNGAILDLPILPNDYCEIRVDRQYIPNGPKAGIKLLMRGLVDSVKLTEATDQGPQGVVSRSVSIGGSDLGKIFQRKQIQLPPDGITDEFNTSFLDYVTTLLGQDADTASGAFEFDMPMEVWIDFFLTKVYSDDKIALGANRLNSSALWIKSEFNLPQTPQGKTRLRVMKAPILNNFQGSLWDFITFYCSKPFLEIFLNDEEDYTVLTCRWVPWLNALEQVPLQHSFTEQGSFPWFDESKVDMLYLKNYDIVTEKQLTRNDFDRYTYFLTKPYQAWFSQGSSGIREGALFADTQPTVDPDGKISTWRNPYYDMAGQDQFGYKPMVVKMPFYGSSGKPGEEIDFELQFIARDCNKWLVDIFTFTDLLYTGSITIIGTPDVKLGQWIKIGDDNDPRQLTGYVQSIEHSWVVSPAPQFLTRLGLTRISSVDGQLNRDRLKGEYLQHLDGVNRPQSISGFALAGLQSRPDPNTL